MPSLIACRYIFRLEAAECEAEGVACPRLTFADNSAVMTLMTSKPTGVFSLMNEEVLIKTRTLTRTQTLCLRLSPRACSRSGARPSGWAADGLPDCMLIASFISSSPDWR